MKKVTGGLVLCLAIFAALPAVAGAATKTFTPVADAYVDSSKSGSNYGRSVDLRADASPIRRSFLRFNVSGLSGAITKATLRIYSNSGSGPLDARGVASTTWGETSITYSNAPAFSAAVAGRSGTVSARSWTTINVTSLVKTTGLLSMAVTTPNTSGSWMLSRESSSAPQLIVETALVDTTPPPAPSFTTTPANPTTATDATFTFATTEAGATYLCQLDAAAFAACTSPVTLTGLAVGSHTFSVKAVDAAGNQSAASAYTWTIQEPPRAAMTATFAPFADAYVTSLNPDSNYGANVNLSAHASPVRKTYMKFEIRGVNGPVTRATLRLYSTASSTVPVDVHTVADTSWGESTITLNNGPAMSATPLASSGAVPVNAWIEIDVTSAVKGDGVVSLGLTTASTVRHWFNSREGANGPKLVVGYEGSAPPPPPTDPVIVGAGDMNDCAGNGDEATAALIDGIPGEVFNIGDNTDSGTAAQFANCYDPTWGRHKARTHPALGNHDYDTDPYAAPYFDYWGAVAGERAKGWYSYNVGTWHIVVLNSMCSRLLTGCVAGSEQEQWLRADLAANPAKCTLAYWHHPLFSSGAVESWMRPMWDALYQAGADVVLNGHAQFYERFAPQTPTGVLDPARGIRQFTIGTAGDNLHPFGTNAANSEVRNNGTFGVAKFVLHPDGYDWEFVPVPGGTFRDSGSAPCH